MSTIKIGSGDWIVVCDGRKAILLENLGDQKFLKLHTKEVREHRETTTAEQGTSAPVRVFASKGGVRSAVEQTDWHDESERAFLKELADRLNHAVTTGETKSLVIVAPPRALGMIRPMYSPSVRKAIHAEIGKDLVKAPVGEIERSLLT